MHIAHRKKIHILFTILTGASFLFFLSFFFVVKDTWIGDVRDNLANVVGMSAVVPENGFNTLAQQLEEEKQAILEREKILSEREAALTNELSRERVGAENRMAIYGTAITFTLLILVISNFYFDIRRERGRVRVIKLQR